MEDVTGDKQKAFQALAEQGLPLLSDHGKLVTQRAGRGDGGGAEQVKEIHRRSAFDGDQGASGKVGGEMLGDTAVSGLLNQGAVLE